MGGNTLKNYYEILEISQNASPEIVDKAYKVLVKKYHPDLQTDNNEKIKCEAKIKEINEAYDVLSNTQKRMEYDNSLKINAPKKEENISNTNNYNKEKIQEEIKRQREETYRRYEQSINKAYHDAYIQDLKNRGYKIKYKKTFNDYLRSLIALLITIGIIILVLQIPFIKNYFIELYNENKIIKNIVDIVSGLFK